jgi:hypothetical protein
MVIKLLFLLSLTLPIYSVDVQNIKIEWGAVDSSAGYQFEYKKSGLFSNVITKKVNQNYIILNDLEDGLYEYRVGVLNRLDKIEGFTPWVTVKIYPMREPKLKSFKPEQFTPEVREKSIEWNGDNFIPATKVYIGKDNEWIEEKGIQYKSTTQLTGSFQIKPDMKFGNYDIKIENNKNKYIIVKSGIIFSEDSKKAAIMSHRAQKIDTGEVPKDAFATPVYSSLWRSTLIPGWGQFYIAEDNWKPWFYTFVVLGSAGAYGSIYSNYLSASNAYQDNLNNLIFLGDSLNSDLIWFSLYNTARTNYIQANSDLQSSQAVIGGIAFVMTINYIDTYLQAKKYSYLDQKQGWKWNYSPSAMKGNSFELKYDYYFE